MNGCGEVPHHVPRIVVLHHLDEAVQPDSAERVALDHPEGDLVQLEADLEVPLLAAGESIVDRRPEEEAEDQENSRGSCDCPANRCAGRAGEESAAPCEEEEPRCDRRGDPGAAREGQDQSCRSEEECPRQESPLQSAPAGEEAGSQDRERQDEEVGVHDRVVEEPGGPEPDGAGDESLPEYLGPVKPGAPDRGGLLRPAGAQRACGGRRRRRGPSGKGPAGRA